MRNTLAILIFAFVSVSFIGLNAQDAESPSSASLYNDGLAKAKAKEYTKALELFKQAIATADPEDEKGAKIIRLSKKNGTRAAYGAGSAARKAKEYETAIAAYETGIEYAPDFYSNYKGIAQCHNAMGDKAAAIKSYLKAAEMATKAEKIDKAKPLVKKAINIIAVASSKKKWDLTIECAEVFLETNESHKVNYSLAKAYDGKGDLQKTIEQVDLAIASTGDTDASKYYMLKAETHEKLGQNDSALAAYKMVTDNKYLELAQYKVNQIQGGK